MTSANREHHRELQQVARTLGYSLRKQVIKKPSKKSLAFRLVNRKTRKTVKRGSLRMMALEILVLAKIANSNKNPNHSTKHSKQS